MEVVQVIADIANAAAGSSYVVARFAAELAAHGDRSSILTTGDDPHPWPYPVPVQARRGALVDAVGFSPQLLGDFRSLLGRPGIIHGHGVWRPINLLPLLARAGQPSRLVWSAHGALSAWSMAHKRAVKEPFWRLFQKRALEACHCLHATSVGEYEDFRRVGLRRPVAIVPPGIDVPPPGSGGRGRTLVYLGRLHPVKGIEDLLRAWKTVESKHPDWEIVIAGPLGGTYADSLQRMGAELPRVRFVGEVQGAAKTQLLAAAGVVVLPSRSENFGMTVAEGLAHGAPVITTTATPWQELPARGCGWVVRPNETEVAEAVSAALALPAAALAAMGLAGRRWMEQEFSWPSVSLRLCASYRWAAEGGDPPAWVRLD